MSNETGISGISLGIGTLLVPFRTLHAHFAPFGYSEPDFRDFLLALGCAPILTPTGEYLVHYFRFLLAIEVATSLGRPPFSKATPLTPSDINASWEGALAHLLASRKYHGLSNPPAIRATLTEVARSLLAQSTRILAALSKRARDRIREDGISPLRIEDPAAPSPFPSVPLGTVPILPLGEPHATLTPQSPDAPAPSTPGPLP